jgi:chemotaxis protein MotB
MSARRKRHEEHEEHENHERWLITYADMITLLMAFFIMLFAMSQLDLAKFKEFQEGFASHVSGKPNIAAEGGVGVLDGTPSSQEELLAKAEQVLNEQAKEDLAADLERDHLLRVEREVTRRVARAGLAGKVGFRLEQRGLVVTIVSDDVLFDLGSDHLRPQGRRVLDGLAQVLEDMPNHVAVEGHTDNTPINGGGQFHNNWVLSTARSTSVLSYLLNEHDIPARRLSAAGYADQRPVRPNTTTSGRAANRRVEIVVLASTTPKEGT